MKKYLLVIVALIATPVWASAPTPIASVELDGKTYPVYQFMKDVKPISTPMPVYPSRAKNEHRGGETHVGTVVNEKGDVSSVFVVESNGAPDIQKAACDAVLKFKFPPILNDKKPIPYVVVVPIVLKTD